MPLSVVVIQAHVDTNDCYFCSRQQKFVKLNAKIQSVPKTGASFV